MQNAEKGSIAAAIAALQRGDAAEARSRLDEHLALHRDDARAWLLLARALGALGEQTTQGAAIDRALELQPRDLTALLAKADFLASNNDLRGGSAYYRAALQAMPRFDQLPPHLQNGLRRAKAAQEKLAHELDEYVRETLSRDGWLSADAPMRFRNAVDLLLGKRRVYAQEPRFLYYPGLPLVEFFPREQFPWLDEVEAATPAIREEVRHLTDAAFRPYVTRTLGRPKAESALLNNPNWSALFLHRDGERQPAADLCPNTMSALSNAPLTDIPGRAPSILFSRLAAGAHIPPHTGVLNARLICHLALVAPHGCELRVGNETQVWKEGKAWVFDDSIEHEARNASDSDRYILLFDIWRPELSDDERGAISALCAAIDEYCGKAVWDA